MDPSSALFNRLYNSFGAPLKEEQIEELKIVVELTKTIAKAILPFQERLDPFPFKYELNSEEPSPTYITRVKVLVSHLFPFSKIRTTLSQEALAITIPGYHDLGFIDIINELLSVHIKNKTLIPSSEIWKDLQSLIQDLSSEKLIQAMGLNYHKWKRGSDPIACYRLFVILEMRVDAHLPLPEVHNPSFKSFPIALENCLSQLSSSSDIKRQVVTIFLELAFKFDTSILFTPINDSTFLDVVTQKLAEIPFESWPGKGTLIARLFERLEKYDQIKFASRLRESTFLDITRLIGTHFYSALIAKTANEKYPHLNQLRKLLPDVFDMTFEGIFRCPFSSFKSQNEWDQDPKPGVRLQCKGDMKVLTHKNLLIGWHTRNHTQWTLFAHDKTSGDLIYSIPLEWKHLIYFEMTSFGIAFVCTNSPFIHLFNHENGEPLGAIDLQMAPIHILDKIHITPSGFCYFTKHEEEGNTVYGGQISNQVWKPSFALKMQKGRSYSLNPFLLFEEYGEKHQLIVSQDGSVHKLDHCQKAFIKNGTLFTHEMRPGPLSAHILAMQPIKDSAKLEFNGPRMEIAIKTCSLELAAIGEEGTAICFKGIEDYPCFVDIAAQQVVEAKIGTKKSGIRYIDTKNLAVWSCNDDHKPLWKQTKDGSKNRGTLGKRSNKIVHIDEAEILYFA